MTRPRKTKPASRIDDALIDQLLAGWQHATAQFALQFGDRFQVAA